MQVNRETGLSNKLQVLYNQQMKDIYRANKINNAI